MNLVNTASGSSIAVELRFASVTTHNFEPFAAEQDDKIRLPSRTALSFSNLSSSSSSPQSPTIADRKHHGDWSLASRTSAAPGVITTCPSLNRALFGITTAGLLWGFHLKGVVQPFQVDAEIAVAD